MSIMLICSEFGKYSNECTSLKGDVICRDCWQKLIGDSNNDIKVN